MKRLACGLLLCVLASATWAGDTSHPVTLWRADGPSNSVYILGSIHLLREEDHPLPRVIDEAYDDAEIIVGEEHDQRSCQRSPPVPADEAVSAAAKLAGYLLAFIAGSTSTGPGQPAPNASRKRRRFSMKVS